MDYRLLGPLEVRVGDSAAPLGGIKQRSVLAVLLLRAGEVVSQDTLLDQVWGERPPKAAKAQIHNCVSRLRHELGAETLLTRAPGYVLQARPEEIDSVRFERAVVSARSLEPAERAAALWEALSMWRGAALADLAFESFAAGEAARLEELRLVALEERIEAELELGRHAVLVPELEALVSRHPLRERLRRAHMVALYRSRRKPDALRSFQEARLALLDELGLEPSGELRDLERRIHADDPSLELPRDETVAKPAPREVRRPGVVICIETETVDDPEASRRLMDACAAAARLAVEQHGGSVQQVLGEEVIAFFGLSAVHEDDALRAARAAVEVRAAYDRLGAPSRIGIAAGEVLTGEEGTPHAASALRQARRLKEAAGLGAILLAPPVLRLVGPAVDAVPADPRGASYRLLRLEPRPAARFDTPLVGRERELSLLQEAVAAVEADRRCRRVVLVGDPGVGKSRLVRELRGRLGERALVLAGRCLAYGEAARHAALADVLRSAPIDTVPDELAPLLAGGAPTAPNPDVFRATRLVLESAGAEQPIVVVLEDVHWAPATLLDLVEYLVAWAGDLPAVLVCVARPELLEQRGSWAADVVAVEPLGEDESRALVQSLTPEVDAGRLDRLLRAADGNPLFLEQLVAFERDPGDVPPTLEMLLASRLDLLPAAEREVLRHASVVGREFTRSAVEWLMTGDAAVASRLASLVRSRFVRPHAGGDGFAFHHALMQDAAYASLPKAVRAELHERLADHLARAGATDAVVGFHLEQAHAYSAELGAERADLARAAAERLGDAGLGALKRLDLSEAVDLLSRAVHLLPEADGARLELACELGTALKGSGDFVGAEELLVQTAENASRTGLERVMQRARIELVWPQVLRGGARVDDSVRFVDGVIASFDHDAGDRLRERAWLCLAALRGRLQGRHAESETAASNALRYARAGGFSLEAPAAMLAADACDGSLPVAEAIVRCEELLTDAAFGRSSELGVRLALAQLLAMRGDANAAREEIENVRTLREEFGLTVAMHRDVALGAAEVEVLAGADDAARVILRAALAALEAEDDAAWAATIGGRLAELLAEIDQPAEALALAARAADLAQPDDIRAQVSWRRAYARAAGTPDTEDLARQAVALLEATDEVNEQARGYAALACVLSVEGRLEEAEEASAAAAALLAGKGNAALRDRLGV